LAIVCAYYHTNLFNVIALTNSDRKYRSESDKLVTISKFPEFLRCELERFAKESSDSNKEYWISLLVDYDRDPHGQGLEKVVNALIKVATKDITKKYILDKLEDFHKAFSMIGGFPNFKSFDNFLNCYETEQPLLPKDFDDPNFNYLTTLSEGYEIKVALRASSNPMVRKAVLDWGDANNKIINVAATISRRKAQQKKAPICKIPKI
jgi:hypothetical protein